MENRMSMIAPGGNVPAVRSIPEIEADILAQKRTIGASIVFIGRALIEAKAQLAHGQWGEWLTERVEFSPSSAENYMRIAREFGEDSRLLSLPYSKVLALLPVPADERETFADANNIEDKSAREIKRLVKERDEAVRKAQAERITASEFRRRSEEAERRIRELKTQKPQSVTVEVAPADYEDAKRRAQEAEEAMQHMIAERNEMLTQMAREIEDAEAERDAALEELEAERLGEGGGEDPLDVTPFCDACSALLNRLYAAPYAKAMLMTRSEVELKRYEMNVRLIMEWAVKVQDVLDEVHSERFGVETVFSII